VSLPCFELFGLPVRFEVDLAALEKAYRAAQRGAHPDRVPQGDARARLLALQRAAAINEAYRILKDPMRRAEELLRRKGIVLGDDTRMDPEFLRDLLDQRESLEEAKRARDLGRVRALGARIDRSREAALARLVAGLDGADVDLADAYARLKYFARFLDEVASIEEQAAEG